MPDIVRTDNAKKPTPKLCIQHFWTHIYDIRSKNGYTDPSLGHLRLLLSLAILKCAKFQRFADKALFVNAYNYLCCYGFPKVCSHADALPGSAY